MGLISQVLLQKDAFLQQKLNIFNRLGGGDDPDLLRNFGNVKVNFWLGVPLCETGLGPSKATFVGNKDFFMSPTPANLVKMKREQGEGRPPHFTLFM